MSIKAPRSAYRDFTAEIKADTAGLKGDALKDYVKAQWAAAKADPVGYPQRLAIAKMNRRAAEALDWKPKPRASKPKKAKQPRLRTIGKTITNSTNAALGFPKGVGFGQVSTLKKKLRIDIESGDSEFDEIRERLQAETDAFNAKLMCEWEASQTL